MTPLSLVAALALAQVPMQKGSLQFDPKLPDVLTKAVGMASTAELDEKRGPGNAISVLETAQLETKPKSRNHLALTMRIAGVKLRQIFLTKDQFPVPIRYEQALSTFARLDLAEPGIRGWLEKTLEHHPYARQRLGKSKQRIMKVAVLTRGTIDRKAAVAAFAKYVQASGITFRSVSPKDAQMIVKLAADEAAPRGAKRGVRVILSAESIRDKKVIWQHSIFRTEYARETPIAMAAALDWIARIGGRDVFFRWLGEQAFHSLLDDGKSEHEKAHEDHKGHAPGPRPQRRR